MENKTTKYFKYAIGEIVLVVIGILIALQINNWNVTRLEKIEEKSILSNLYNEFSQNKKALAIVLKNNKKCYQSGIKIMSLIGKKTNELNIINTDSLIYRTIEFNSFDPSENALSDLIQSGRLQLLKNDKLKDLLYQWSRNIIRAKETYDGLDTKIENTIVPYLTKSYSMKDVDRYGPLKWKSKSTLKIDKLNIFKDIEYENLMDDLLYRHHTYATSLEALKKIIENILIETAKYD